MLHAALYLAALAPTPSPTPELDENLITPGPIGFLFIFLIAVAAVLLIVDMTRRVRRVRYRAEVREEIEREQAAKSGDDTPR
ncbi:hypothetical protein ACFSBZ_07595 [Amnibacterium flavum]|uniref:hypothetical protein n=1 Tax=Amnibacterium flavum TaxID=2173173 RepID=UPI001F0C79BA|nr:hypothetical protein [Amnibacterium flavum]